MNLNSILVGSRRLRGLAQTYRSSGDKWIELFSPCIQSMIGQLNSLSIKTIKPLNKRKGLTEAQALKTKPDGRGNPLWFHRLFHNFYSNQPKRLQQTAGLKNL